MTSILGTADAYKHLQITTNKQGHTSSPDNLSDYWYQVTANKYLYACRPFPELPPSIGVVLVIRYCTIEKSHPSISLYKKGIEKMLQNNTLSKCIS